jgi:hypothetical protein
VLIGEDVVAVEDEAGAPTIDGIAVFVVAGQPDGHGVVAGDDEAGAEHLRQPQVSAALPLRHRTLRDVLLAHDGQVLVPAQRQEQPGAFHSSEEAG